MRDGVFYRLAALAQTYPSKPVRMIVPYPLGGGNDTLARVAGAKLSERHARTVQRLT